MADFGLFIGFGSPARGRERQAIDLFNEATEYCSGLQQQGEIESFEPILVEPHGGNLAGFFLLRGDRAKLDGVRDSDAFRRLIVRAGILTDSVGVTNAGMAGRIVSQMKTYAEQVEDLT